MPLKCPKCGSRNTVTETAGNIELLKEIIRAIQRLFRFLEQRERNNAPVLICKDCGYYERI